MSDTKRDFYIHGDDAPILRRWSGRTPQNSAGFLLPYLRPDTDLLDIGCGPGTITAGFAALCSAGRVVGIDIGENAIQHALQTVTKPNVTFQVASANNLPFADESFDVVHAHQVFIYLATPVVALSEIRRVLRPHGIVALRDSLFCEAAVEPLHPGLQLFMRLVPESYKQSDGDPTVARRMPQLLRDTGFNLVRRSASAVFLEGEHLPGFVADWKLLLTQSPMLETWRKQGLVNDADEILLREGMKALGDSEDGFILWPAIEVVGKKKQVES